MLHEDELCITDAVGHYNNTLCIIMLLGFLVHNSTHQNGCFCKICSFFKVYTLYSSICYMYEMCSYLTLIRESSVHAVTNVSGLTTDQFVFACSLPLWWQ